VAASAERRLTVPRLGREVTWAGGLNVPCPFKTALAGRILGRAETITLAVKDNYGRTQTTTYPAKMT
jgi:hypothetical protein